MMDPIIHPTAGPVKLGRLPPHPGARRLHLGTYVTRSALPTPPSATSYSPLAQPCLDEMLLNDTLGDCTTVASMKVAALILASAGTPIKFSNAQAQAFYSLSTGYVPGKPGTDQGGDEVTVLNCWRQHGLEKGLHAIAGHVSVDGTNTLLVKTALSTLKNLYFGVSLPDSWLTAQPGSTFDDREPANPQNGHAFCGTHYDAVGVWVVLWGGVPARLTWAAVAKYTAMSNGGELHTVISHDAIAKGTARPFTGIDWSALQAAFRGLGGSV